jgi:hypothetical protein
MKTKNQWIKTSERAPTEADLPVWAYYSNKIIHIYFTGVPDGCIYWRPAASDIPAPPIEETEPEHLTVWHAALAWERSQVAGMLPDAFKWDGIEPNGSASRRNACEKAIEAIRARCNGGGK